MHLHLIHCCFDRTLFKSSQSDFFSNGGCHYLQFLGYDLKPIDSILDPTKLQKVFRYDWRLRNNEEVKHIYILQFPRASYRHAIAEWSKTPFVNNHNKIVELHDALAKAMSNLTSDDSLMSTLNKKLIQAYMGEEE